MLHYKVLCTFIQQNPFGYYNHLYFPIVYICTLIGYTTHAVHYTYSYIYKVYIEIKPLHLICNLKEYTLLFECHTLQWEASQTGFNMIDF